MTGYKTISMPLPRSGIVFILVLLILSLSACGFHLRGSQVLAPGLKDFYIQDAPVHSEFARLLAQRLRELGADIVTAAQADAVVRVFAERSSERQLSVGDAGRVQEFELTYRLSVALVDPQGQELLPRRELVLKRDLRFHESQVMVKSSETQLLLTEMAQDAVSQFLRQLRVLSNKGSRSATAGE